MSVRDISIKLSNVFNWLAEPPERQRTLSSLIPWATDNRLQEPFGKPPKMSRAAWAVNRAFTGLGIVMGGVVCVMEASPLPMLAVPFLFKGLGYMASGVTEWGIKGLADRANQLEGYTKGREFKAQNRQALPRYMR